MPNLTDQTIVLTLGDVPNTNAIPQSTVPHHTHKLEDLIGKEYDVLQQYLNVERATALFQNLIAISGITNGSNIGGGVEIFKSKIGSLLTFKTLLAGSPGISIVENQANGTIVIDVTGDGSSDGGTY